MSIRVSLMLVLGGFILLCQTADASAQEPDTFFTSANLADLSGTYKSNYGRVTIVQNGTSVTGKIKYTNGAVGTFTGVAREGNLFIVWQHKTDYGTARLKLFNGGKSLNGTFTDQKGVTGTWKLNKVDPEVFRIFNFWR